MYIAWFSNELFSDENNNDMEEEEEVEEEQVKKKKEKKQKTKRQESTTSISFDQSLPSSHEVRKLYRKMFRDQESMQLFKVPTGKKIHKTFF